MPSDKAEVGPNSDKRMTKGRELLRHNPNDPPLPCIVLNTLFKSASVYTCKTLQQSLGLSFQFISPGYFPEDLINVDQLRDFFVTGSAITQEYLNPVGHNIQNLKRFTDRMVLQLCDPRAAILSIAYDFIGQHQRVEDDLLWHVTPSPLTEYRYFYWPLARQLDWLIENLLPVMVIWIKSWIDFAQTDRGEVNQLRVFFTTLETLVADEQAYFERIVDFYEISRSRFNFTPAEKTAETDLRKVELDEWKRVCTPAQIQRMNDLIPLCILQKFNWELPEPRAFASSSSSAILPLGARLKRPRPVRISSAGTLEASPRASPTAASSAKKSNWIAPVPPGAKLG